MFTALACLAAGAEVRRPVARLHLGPAVAVGVVALLGLLIARLFPSGGRFHFPAATLAQVLVFAAAGAVLTWRHSPRLRAFFVAYGSTAVLAFAVPSPLGALMARLQFVALPIALLAVSVRRFAPRPVVAVALVAAAAWNLVPLGLALGRSHDDPSASAAFWAPAADFLQARLGPSFRVEVVATENHWEALHLPRAGVPIARGWFRQDDFPQNAALYSSLSPVEYRAWLRSLGIRYVVLSDAPADWSARREQRLLRSGRAGLPVAFRSDHLTIYRLPSPAPILTGPSPAVVTLHQRRRMRLLVGTPGRYRLAVRYSPYWRPSPFVCATPRADGMTDLLVARPGAVELVFAPGFRSALDAVLGRGARCGRPRASASTATTPKVSVRVRRAWDPDPAGFVRAKALGHLRTGSHQQFIGGP